MDIQTKDGILLRGIPDGTPEEVIKARILKIRASRGASPADQDRSRVAEIPTDLPAGYDPTQAKRTRLAATNTELTLPEKAMLALGKLPFGAPGQRAVDLAAGASSLMRGGANMLIPGAGEKIWPTSGATDSGWRTAGEFADPVGLAAGYGVAKLAPAVPYLGKLFAKGGYENVLNKAATATDPAVKGGGAAAFGRNVASGATTGGTIGALSEGGNAETGAGIGVAANIALPPALSGGAKFTAYIYDVLAKRYGAVSAGKILRQAAGGDLAAAKAITAAAGNDNLTAAQVTAGLKNDMLDALGELAKRNDTSSYFSRKKAEQETSRIASLEKIKPDLKTAIANRENAARPLYEAARNAGNVVDTAPVVAKIDDLLEQNPGNQALVQSLNRVRSGLFDAEGNIRTNAQQVASTLDDIKTLIANKDNKFILRELVSLKDDLAKTIPGYQVAQKRFAEMSPPVNQSQVLQAMTDVLKTPGGGERVRPFLNVLGKGEEAMLKKSTGYPRYESGDLSKILTQDQLGAVNKIASELERDLSVKSGAKSGAGGLQRILEEGDVSFILPNWINAQISITNRALRAIEGFLNKSTVEHLYAGMRTGKGMNELLNTLPTSERNEVIAALIKQRPEWMGAAQGGLVSGVLSGRQPPQQSFLNP